MAKAAKIDESMFEATPIRSFKEAIKSDDQRTGAHSGQSNNIKLVNGKNTVRFAPKRRGEKNWMVTRRSTWMTINGDQGDKIRRPINDSVVHAGSKFDIIDEYIKLAQKNLNPAQLTILADREKGLQTKNTTIAYAWLKKVVDGEVSWTFGEYEFTKSVRDGLEAAMAMEDEEDELTVDPYTPVKTGACAIITFNKEAKRAADYYKVGIS